MNETSLRIGDYEDLKKAAIDPYVSIRNAYIQHRQKKGGRIEIPGRKKGRLIVSQKYIY